MGGAVAGIAQSESESTAVQIEVGGVRIALASSSMNRPLVTMYSLYARSKSPCALLTMIAAFCGLRRPGWMGLDCWRLVMSVQATHGMVIANAGAYRRQEGSLGAADCTAVLDVIGAGRGTATCRLSKRVSHGQAEVEGEAVNN